MTNQWQHRRRRRHHESRGPNRQERERDGSLDGICLAGQRVSLTISSTSNEQTTLRLEEVSLLVADELRESNIINAISIVSVADSERDAPLRDRVKEKLLVEWPQVDKGALIFHLDCSYGVEIWALCRRVTRE